GGASGIVPGCIMGLCKDKNLGRDEAVKGLLTAGLFGVFMAETDYFGGWGCQAEIGCGVGMAAAGLVGMMGGTAKEAEAAAVMGIQSLIGLVCDSVCGQSQVPCYLRNMTGTATAAVCANAAMAGLDALIPLEEMVQALIRVGRASRSIKLNSMGANGTPTGVRLEEEELARQKKIVDEKLGKH
ncbi:MAG: L-serine ammonia-lyase, iron-sulfur-dependent, subunit alpha, partial [Clostridia bacterium]|nr:L-serine ammonia-lyase, iron-sulfur-dependent, subunit alpha [Clostridia bacterium]